MLQNLTSKDNTDTLIYPFQLDFQEETHACFSFMMYGQEVQQGISCCISSCSAGNMVCREAGISPAQSGLYASLGLNPDMVYTCTQVHSQEVVVIEPGIPNNSPKADGMISRDWGVWLSVVVADCLPVFLYDTEHGCFGVVHSGWKGTGISLKALKLMEARWHTRAEALAVILGPCICSDCYWVDEERARAFEAAFGGSDGTYPLGPIIREFASCGESSQKEFTLDLQAVNARLLADAGVRNIMVCKDCTFTDKRLGSFRREGAIYTRMAAIIGAFQD